MLKLLEELKLTKAFNNYKKSFGVKECLYFAGEDIKNYVFTDADICMFLHETYGREFCDKHSIKKGSSHDYFKDNVWVGRSIVSGGKSMKGVCINVILEDVGCLCVSISDLRDHYDNIFHIGWWEENVGVRITSDLLSKNRERELKDDSVGGGAKVGLDFTPIKLRPCVKMYDGEVDWLTIRLYLYNGYGTTKKWISCLDVYNDNLSPDLKEYNEIYELLVGYYNLCITTCETEYIREVAKGCLTVLTKYKSDIERAALSGNKLYGSIYFDVERECFERPIEFIKHTEEPNKKEDNIMSACIDNLFMFLVGKEY